jgi:hypothetical protein
LEIHFYRISPSQGKTQSWHWLSTQHCQNHTFNLSAGFICNLQFQWVSITLGEDSVNCLFSFDTQKQHTLYKQIKKPFGNNTQSSSCFTCCITLVGEPCNKVLPSHTVNTF